MPIRAIRGENDSGLSILMKKDEYNEFNTKVTDATGGKAVFEDEEDREYREEVKEK